MDDLFQYLIYGIIIISFLSSFFKKKEQPKQNPLPRSQEPDAISYQQKNTSLNSDVAVKKNEEYNILRELENMFKGNIKIPEQQKPKQVDPYDIYQSHEIEDKNLDLVVDERMHHGVEDQKPLSSRTTYDDKKNYGRSNVTVNQKQKRKISPKAESSAKEFEKVLAGPRKQRASINAFNCKLKNPDKIKEYIIISEILGKPKALRR